VGKVNLSIKACFDVRLYCFSLTVTEDVEREEIGCKTGESGSAIFSIIIHRFLNLQL
jgi:hypothetical protein